MLQGVVTISSWLLNHKRTTTVIIVQFGTTMRCPDDFAVELTAPGMCREVGFLSSQLTVDNSPFWWREHEGTMHNCLNNWFNKGILLLVTGDCDVFLHNFAGLQVVFPQNRQNISIKEHQYMWLFHMIFVKEKNRLVKLRWVLSLGSERGCSPLRDLASSRSKKVGDRWQMCKMPSIFCLKKKYIIIYIYIYINLNKF